MPSLYRSKSPLTSVEPQALVIHCSAARYQQHFEEFLTAGLQLEDYSLIAIPGGVQVLTLTDYLPKFSWATSRWAKFLVDADRPPRLVLIGHQDCRWYQSLRFWESGPALDQRIAADLRRAGESVQQRFPKVRVELYFARTDPQGHVEFHAL
jgi:hypothetical protein